PVEDGAAEGEDKILVSVTLPKSNPETGKVESENLYAIAATSKEARLKFAMQTELFLVSGQLRNALLGLDLAKKGIENYVDTLLRDPEISPRVRITVVNGNTHDLLFKKYPQHPRTGQYIDRMIAKESRVHAIPSITLHHFARDYYDEGIDPVVPM